MKTLLPYIALVTALLTLSFFIVPVAHTHGGNPYNPLCFLCIAISVANGAAAPPPAPAVALHFVISFLPTFTSPLTGGCPSTLLSARSPPPQS